MILGFLAAVGSSIASGIIIESVTAGVGLGISVYTASKCVRQSGRTRRRK
jgi:hypothetical protein